MFTFGPDGGAAVSSANGKALAGVGRARFGSPTDHCRRDSAQGQSLPGGGVGGPGPAGSGAPCQGGAFAGASDSRLITRVKVDPLMGGTGMHVNFVTLEPEA